LEIRTGAARSEKLRDPKAVADLFLKKVLTRLEANRESWKLAESLAHLVNPAALPANPTAELPESPEAWLVN
jgi:predicted RNA polymerase sigma factor